MANSTRRLALAAVMFAALFAASAGAEDARPFVEALDGDLSAAIRDLQALVGETYAPA